LGKPKSFLCIFLGFPKKSCTFLGFLKREKNRRLEKTWEWVEAPPKSCAKILNRFFSFRDVKIMGTYHPTHTPTTVGVRFSLTRFNQSSKLVGSNYAVKVCTNTVVRSLQINPFKSFFIVNCTRGHLGHLFGKNRCNFFA